MASYDYTFQSGDGVTPTRLNAARTISNIVAADLASAAVTTAKIADANVTTAKIADANVTMAKIADANVTTAKLATVTQQSLVPAGAVMPFAMNSAPSGWLAADGAAVSRSTYAALFSAIGTTHGGGDGSTTFNLPDLRGIFVRGSGSQTISGTTYNKTFAAKEGDAIRNITGEMFIQNATPGSPTGAFKTGTVNTQFGGGNFNPGNYPRVGFDAAQVVPTASENRPANIALLYCIKF